MTDTVHTHTHDDAVAELHEVMANNRLNVPALVELNRSREHGFLAEMSAEILYQASAMSELYQIVTGENPGKTRPTVLAERLLQRYHFVPIEPDTTVDL